MRVAKITHQIYKFSELSDKARDKAITNEIQVILDMENPLPKEVQRGVTKAQKLRTEWWTNAIVYETAKKYIDNRCAQYEYFANGDIFGIITE